MLIQLYTMCSSFCVETVECQFLTVSKVQKQSKVYSPVSIVLFFKDFCLSWVELPSELCCARILVYVFGFECKNNLGGC